MLAGVWQRLQFGVLVDADLRRDLWRRLSLRLSRRFEMRGAGRTTERRDVQQGGLVRRAVYGELRGALRGQRLRRHLRGR